VSFHDQESANRAIDLSHGKFQVSEYISKEKRASTGTNLYVKNFPTPYLTDDELKSSFEEFGEITSCVVMKDENG
jgi:RNA recognition motif-containing protein